MTLSIVSSSLIEAQRAPAAAAIVVPSRAPDWRANEIAEISHELRNSLCVVRNAARLLRLPIGADGIDGARVLIERHVGQMSRFIDDLLDDSLVSGHKKTLQLTHLDLRGTIGNAIDAIAPDLTRRGHQLTIHLPAEPLWVNADGARLEQVFSNILINAAKYTPDGGEIVVTMEHLGDKASVRIRDSGIGIAPELIARVFDMFVQADPAALRAEGGHGIGLAVVRDLVEQHGGIVRATSAGLGTGSEVTVLLPTL